MARFALKNLQLARTGTIACTGKLQVSPLRPQKTRPSVEMTD